MQKVKELLNRFIDMIFEIQHKFKKHKPLTNEKLASALANGTLYIACIISKNNNPISKLISFFSGPFSHIVVIFNSENYQWTVGQWERLVKKFVDYYGVFEPFKYIVLASADDNGMNYFDVSVYQNREMIIFKLNDFKQEIINEFLSPQVMDANYDYTWLAGQMFKNKKIIKLFDDERAYGCSEQIEILRKFIPLCKMDEPTPTEVYAWFLNQHVEVVYDNLKKKY